MKKFILSLLIILSFNYPTETKAGYTHEFRKVSIELKNHKKINGYIIWYYDWPYNGNFPNNDVPFNKYSEREDEFSEILTEIEVYKNISFYSLEPDIEIPLILKNDVETVQLEQIKTMKSVPGKYNGATANALQVISSQMAELLKNKPAAKYCKEDGMGGRCYVSFNKSINEKNLIQFDKSFYKSIKSPYYDDKNEIIYFYFTDGD